MGIEESPSFHKNDEQVQEHNKIRLHEKLKGDIIITNNPLKVRRP